MSAVADALTRDTVFDPYNVGRDAIPNTATGHGEGGPASKRTVVGYGFWIYLLSDIIMFSAFFAAYAVLSHATAGGPSGKDLFNLQTAAAETVLLLVSSFTCGLAAIAVRARNMFWAQAMLLTTGLLGLAFLALEFNEFSTLISAGAGPSRSAFLSSFFALVGCHGLHISAGLGGLALMMTQLCAWGFTPVVMRRLLCFVLFWHALDIVWVAIFSTVYLGAFA